MPMTGAGVPRTLAWCQNGAVAGASVTDKVTDGAGSTVKPGKSAQVREMYETGKKKGGSSFGETKESNPPPVLNPPIPPKPQNLRSKLSVRESCSDAPPSPEATKLAPVRVSYHLFSVVLLFRKNYQSKSRGSFRKV